ncbi:hypothetical protein MRS76_11265 [Rhizobiaceae bacterium n13]|uniref:hypothetical protein n=1 Tax=Ferirhizobium litorale TaxID=2927786 RepID=UPI0024B2CCA2|nr:hypothetical protein [Fererhizobium litorale]MDI7862540.1 hypothetical protein [Fererhizobium litorale]
MGFIVSSFRADNFATLGETMPKENIRPQSTAANPDDVGDRRHAPPAGPEIEVLLPPDWARHPHHGPGAGEMRNCGIGRIVRHDIDSGAIKIVVVEHPGIRRMNDAER